MVKNKRIFLSLIVALLCVSIALFAFACNKDSSSTDDDDDTTEETALFTNGTFTKFSTNSDGSASYPASPTSWTATPGSTTSTKTPQGSDDISVGVISVGSDYDASLYDNAGNPGKPEEAKDNKILMIHNKVATAYSYVSSTTTVEKNTYYMLTFWVKTVGLAPKNEGEEYGAYVYIKNGAYVEFNAINTNGEWVQYTTYFRGSNSADKTFTLTLGLGEGNYTDGHMVSGYAYFDNVVLTDKTNVEEGQTAMDEDAYNAIQTNATTAKYDLRTLDGNFNYASLSTAPIYSPNQITGSAGTGSGSDASTGSTYLEKGVIDITPTSGDTFSKVFSGYSANAITLNKVFDTDLGNKLVVIHNKQKTAYSYKDSVGMLIENAKYYKITIYAQTFINDASKADSKGANLAINSSSSTTLEEFEDIDTNGQWKQYTFYVKGNQYSDNTLYFSMALGTGGSGDGDWVQGVAFFDDLTYEEIPENQYTAAVNSATVKTYSYETIENNDDIQNLANFNSTQYEESFLNADGTLRYTTMKVEEKTSPFTKKVEVTPGVYEDVKLDVLNITNNKLSAYSAATIYKDTADDSAIDGNKITINPNSAYQITFWVKTANLSDGASASVALVGYDMDKQADYSKCKTTLSTMSSINEDTLKSFAVDDYDNYSLITFYVLGDISDTKYVGLDITFGTATAASTSASFTKGTFYLTNLRVTKIDYDKYTAATTGTTTFKYSYVGSGSTGEVSSNGTFNYVDMESTISLHKNDADSAWNDQGKLQLTGSPTNWAITESKALVENGGDSTAGIVDLQYFKKFADATYTVDYEHIYDAMTAGLKYKDNPQVLFIDAVNTPNLGYKSNSISLSANSYYVFSVYAYSLDGRALSFTVEQSGVTDLKDSSIRIANTDANTWKQYLIYVKTGITSTSVNVTLYAGDAIAESNNSSQAIFTLATYATIDETIYNAAVATEAGADDTYDAAGKGIIVKKLAWFTDTMYLTSSASTDTTLATPTNWTGAAIDSNASTETEDLAKGIFDQLNDNWNIIDIDPDAENSFAEKIFTADKKHGNTVLIIDNKKATSYGYTSSSFTLSASKYYKISIDVLTKDLKFLREADVDKDDDAYDGFSEKNIYDTATVTLTANNKTYTFGKHVEKDKTRDDFTGDTAAADYKEYVLNKTRIINVDSWTTYTYYIALDEDVEEDVSATLKISIGGKSVSYWESGYVFIDNFTVEEMNKDAYTAATEGYDAKLDPDNEAYDATLTSKTYKIDYTNEDATAEEETDDDDEEEEEPATDTKDWLWLYITSGVIGGILVIILLIYIIKKYAPKKKFKVNKKTLTKDNSTRGKFSD